MKLTLKYLLDYAFSDTSTVISLCVENHKLHRTYKKIIQKKMYKNCIVTLKKKKTEITLRFQNCLRLDKFSDHHKTSTLKQILFEIRFRIISSLG